MQMSPDDTRALKSQLGVLRARFEAVENAKDTEAMARALRWLSLAALDAQTLLQAIDDNTRTAALREVELRLEQQVGMEPEHL